MRICDKNTTLGFTKGTGQIYITLFPSQSVPQRPAEAWTPSQIEVYAWLEILSPVACVRAFFLPSTAMANVSRVPTTAHVFTRIILVNPHHSPAMSAFLFLDFNRLKLRFREVWQFAKGHAANESRDSNTSLSYSKRHSFCAYNQLPASHFSLTELLPFCKMKPICF